MTLSENWTEESNKVIKEEINVVIVEDVEKYRKEIIDLLPSKLIEYNINFQEFQGFNSSKTYFNHTTKANTFCVLDNNFHKYENESSITSNIWHRLYSFLLRKKPKIAEKTASFSSYTHREIRQLYGDDIKIISWKSSNSTSYVKEIAEWIKAVVEWEEK